MVGVATAVVCLDESEPVLQHRLFDAKRPRHLKPEHNDGDNGEESMQET